MTCVCRQDGLIRRLASLPPAQSQAPHHALNRRSRFGEDDALVDSGGLAAPEDDSSIDDHRVHGRGPAEGGELKHGMQSGLGVRNIIAADDEVSPTARHETARVSATTDGDGRVDGHHLHEALRGDGLAGLRCCVKREARGLANRAMCRAIDTQSDVHAEAVQLRHPTANPIGGGLEQVVGRAPHDRRIGLHKGLDFPVADDVHMDEGRVPIEDPKLGEMHDAWMAQACLLRHAHAERKAEMLCEANAVPVGALLGGAL
jgi:hypothetical protein